MFLKWILLSPRGRDLCPIGTIQSVVSWHFILFSGEAEALWTIEHCLFAHDSYMKNNKTVTAVHREFWRHFNIYRNQAVPTHNTILRWVNALCTWGTSMNRRPLKAPLMVRSPENVRVRQALIQSPNCSAQRHSNEPGVDNQSVRCFFHEDLHFLYTGQFEGSYSCGSRPNWQNNAKKWRPTS